jgi:hypothetical protein
MQRDEVIRLATNYARHKGYAVEQYNLSVTYNQHEWQIFFQSKAAKPDPGDFCTVYVDDQSGTVTNFVRGK